MEKRDLSERDICTKLITPAILQAGWKQEQFREEVKLTPGRVVVWGKVAQRVKDPEAQGGPKRSDYVLYAKPNIALATLEAKRNVFLVGHGMQQALTSLKLRQRRLHQRTQERRSGITTAKPSRRARSQSLDGGGLPGHPPLPCKRTTPFPRHHYVVSDS